MATTPTYINQRINNLQAQINAISPYPPIADSLASVLLIGNSAGATDVNMNNQDILAVDNINLVTINGVAYPPVVAVPTLNSVLIAGNTATGTTAKITLNNSGAGGTANPLASLNLTTAVGTGILVEEVYNQRNPVVGEFARKSFYSKTTTNVKTEYARITANSPSVTNLSQKGRLDMEVNVNGTLATYLSVNGNTQEVDLFRQLHMNGQPIRVCPNITTQNLNTYGKNTVQFYNSDTTIPPYTPDDQLRLTMINEGVADVVTPLTGSFATWGNILCSCDYNSYTWVGTDNGFVYYSNDGVTWTGITDSFNGAINALAVNPNTGLLYIGGAFTQTVGSFLSCSLLAQCDTAGNISQVVWSNIGSNGFTGSVVKCITVANTNYLYIGGRFTADGVGALGCQNIAIVDTTQNLYCMDNSTGIGYGYDNTVNFIHQDATNGAFFIIGGEFTNVNSAYGNTSQQRNSIWNTNDYNSITAPYEVTTMNAEPVAVTQNGSDIYIGGYFTGLPFGDYLTNFQWDGVVYQVVANPYSATPSAPLTTVLQDGGIFWTDTNGKLWEANVNVGSAPFGYFIWIDRAVWGQLIFSTNALAQNPTVAYFLFTGNLINLSLTTGTLYYGQTPYTGGISLTEIGSAVDMIYQSSLNRWYVLSAISAGFF
jgi:hypothetical protein